MTYDARSLVAFAERQLGERPALHLAAVARASRVSVATLSRALHTELGLSFRAWRRVTLRPTAESKLSEVPPRSIKEISADLGFATPRSFARWCRRELGLSPTECRLRCDYPADVAHPSAGRQRNDGCASSPSEASTRTDEGV